MITRRFFLKSSLIGGAALALPGTVSSLISTRTWSALAEPLLEVAAGETLITILHTNDTHSQIDPIDNSDKQNGGKGGVARRATLVKRIRKENPNTLLIDAGDVFQGTPYFNFYKGEVEYKAMSLIGYDVVKLGDTQVSAQVSGIDFIASGHTHTFMEKPVLQKNPEGKDTIIFQVGKSGIYVGRVDFKLKDGKVIASAGRLLDLRDESLG